MRADAGSGVAVPVKLNTANDAIIPMDNADSWIVGSDRMDRDTGDATKNYRAFFNKVKGAFRTGQSTGAEWDDANVGLLSYAEGNSNRASGDVAHAEGQGTVASGSNAHSEGQNTTASGAQSHAEGYITNASGARAHAEGTSSTASALNSHAEGNASAASGSSAHAEGSICTASGLGAHAEGNGAIASGDYSHAEGSSSLASRLNQYAKSSGSFAVRSDAQMGHMVHRAQTTGATSALLSGVGEQAGWKTGNATAYITLGVSRAFQLKISAVARRTDVQGEVAGWTWDGVVNRDSTGSAYIVGTPIIAAWGAAGAAAWDLTVSIDTTDATNNIVAVTATGEAGKTIRWVAKMEWVEVAG